MPPDQQASLEKLSRDAARLAEALARAAADEAQREAARASRIRVTAPQVRRLIEARRRRAARFALGPGNAAWSLMLELFAARLEGRRHSLSQLAAAAGIAPTTALRAIETLERAGLAERRPAPGPVQSAAEGPALSGVEGPVLSAAEGPVPSAAEGPVPTGSKRGRNAQPDLTDDAAGRMYDYLRAAIAAGTSI